MIRLGRLFIVLFALLQSAALAGIGEPVSRLLADLEARAPQEAGEGYAITGGVSFAPEERGGLLYAVTGEATLDEEGLAAVADVVAAGTGYGATISGPVRDFLAQRAGELAGVGPVAIAVEEFRLLLDVTGESAPYRLSFELTLAEIPEEAFLEAAHSLGPADAPFVVREFADFQCPFCASFAGTVLPEIKEELLARGDVRFEYHHFPLKSIHANAAPAAEAAECVVEANDEASFWTYHDALFERMQAWQGLGDPYPYFVRLAGELGLETSGVEACLDEGRYRNEIDRAYGHAAEVLRINSTPTLFVNGYRLGDYREIDAYLELFELIDAFAAE